VLRSGGQRSIITVGSVLILAGLEAFGLAFATAWALGGLFQLGDTITYALIVLFSILAAVPMVKLAQMAFAVKPIRGRNQDLP
jgi:hypothetical protein